MVQYVYFFAISIHIAMDMYTFDMHRQMAIPL